LRAGTVRQIAPRRHDAFEPELAPVLEDYRTVSFDMIDEVHPLGPRSQVSPSSFKRKLKVIHTVELEQIEGVEEYLIVVGARVQLFEAW
jgi:hypothetical protein